MPQIGKVATEGNVPLKIERPTHTSPAGDALAFIKQNDHEQIVASAVQAGHENTAATL